MFSKKRWLPTNKLPADSRRTTAGKSILENALAANNEELLDWSRCVKIGLVTEIFDPLKGGAEAWTHQHAINLLQQGCEVHIIAHEVAAEAAALPVAIHRLDKCRTRLALAAAAETKLRSLDLDVIHDMGVGWHCDVFQPHGGCWAAIIRQKLLLTKPWLRPIKCRIDPWLPRYRQLHIIAKRQANSPYNILLALSHKVGDEFQSFYGISPNRIHVVYNGVDINRFSPERREEFRRSVRQSLGISDDTALAVAVAHNFQLKGVPTLLKALEMLAPKRLPLQAVVVGGKWVYTWRLWAKAKRLPITFVGPKRDAVPYYAAADMLVHPSFYDSCSLVLLEGAASGLPLLVSRQNGAAELLTDGVEGLLLDDPADARRLAEQLETMLDPALRRQMGAAARKLASQHTLDRNCREILEIYDRCGQSRRQAA
jgi:UDP-glucose:(heptosyl)LPS alpha-1,3-glucosyltransferase